MHNKPTIHRAKMHSCLHFPALQTIVDTRMLKRKIDDRFTSWKNNPDHLPLVVEGARQVGKTTSIETFAQKTYKTFYNLNFFSDPGLMTIFDGALDPESIITRITLAFPSQKYVPGSTLILLDEIQHCPNARTALKFLAKHSDFDVIASGSLLGISLSDETSLPVGYTETVKMHPLDFEEFLWATDISEKVISELKSCFHDRRPVDDYVHQRMLDYFAMYTVVGGMPAIVASFAKDRDYSKVLRMQRGIVADYRKDAVKYAEGSEKVKVVRCLDSIPAQLAKANKKFQYSVVEKKASSRKYGDSLIWLEDAGIVNLCRNLSRIDSPLAGFAKDNEFKLYFNDTGLLISMYEDGTARRIVEGEMGIHKGAIYENIVASALASQDIPLFYFAPSDTLEIDFVINFRGRPCLVEVKSGENTKSKSLNTVLGNLKYNVDQAIRLSRKNVGEDGGIIALPLYMVTFLKQTDDCGWLPSLASSDDLESHL